MGDEILKKILFSILILLNVCFSNLLAKDSETQEINEYNRLFSEISDRRVGLEQKNIIKVKNPFLITHSLSNNDSNASKSLSEITYTLYAIFGNKAKINNHWYVLNEKIGYYQLTKIKQNSVLITSASEKKELFLRKSNGTNIQFSSK